MLSHFEETELYKVIEKLVNTRDDLSNSISDKAKKSITDCCNMLNELIEDAKY